MYVIENSNCYYQEEEIQSYILNMNALEVLQQNSDGAFNDMGNNEKWTDANWFINGLKFELFVTCILWKEEYINLTTVLNELEQRNKLYIHGVSCETIYEIFNKEIKQKNII